MKHLQPVIWSKGTFLTPQHLQVHDRYIESLLGFRLKAQNFRPWGFKELGIDHEELAAGNFVVTRASGIFPDGLTFDIPDSDSPPPPKALADQFEADQREMDLFLGIPPFRERGVNVALQDGGADARFRAEPTSIRDENSGAAEKQILVARKNFRVLTEPETKQDVLVMRIARVQRTAADTFQLDPQVVPPLFAISASDYLVSIVRRLVEILAAKSSSLASVRRQRNQSLADFTASDIANFWLLYTVNTYFPELRHLYETNRGHPEELFSVMTSMAGALTTFSSTIRPGDLPAYDHNELGQCFRDLDEKLRELLETVVPSNFVALPLKEIRNSIYATDLADDKYFVNTKLYLAVAAESSRANIIRRAPQLVKVCSADHVDHLVRQALPGVQLSHTPVPPAAIPVKVNYEYFSLSQSGAAWEAICRARNLAAYVPSDLPNPQMELIILLPQA